MLCFAQLQNDNSQINSEKFPGGLIAKTLKTRYTNSASDKCRHCLNLISILAKFKLYNDSEFQKQIEADI